MRAESARGPAAAGWFEMIGGLAFALGCSRL
jgi:hypothetical protein